MVGKLFYSHSRVNNKIMEIIKLGLIYSVNGKNGFDISHCHKPTPIIIDEHTVRVYFGARDENNKTRITFVDLDSKNPSKLKYIHKKPILDLGKTGTFDDSGVNVCSVIKKDNEIWMYYIGVNTSTTVHMRNSIGVAISKDNGVTFSRLYEGPVLDRTKTEPYYVGACDVIQDGEQWICYYTCGKHWATINNKHEINYQIQRASSNNGVDWLRDNKIVITPENEYEVCARPSVWKENNIYHMLYSKRSMAEFREDPRMNYRAGYATSLDGINWSRCDEKLDLNPSESGWDSDAIAYPCFLSLNGKKYIFYNGNGFGKTGFGIAELITR